MNSEDLKKLHEEYRRSIEATRNPESEEEAKKASDAMIDLRHKLDAAIIEKEEEREDEQRAAAVEARMQTAAKVAGMAPDPMQKFNDEARALLTGETSKLVVDYSGVESRTDMTTVDTTIYGKYTFANPVWRSVEMMLVAQSGLLKCNPRQIRTPGFEIMYIPKEVTAAVGTAHAEGATATVSDPVLGRTTLGAQRYDGFFSVSDEMLASSDLNFAGLLGELAGQALGTQVAAGLAAGAGTGTLPQGVFGKTTTTTVLGVTAAAVDTFTFDELISLKLSVLPGYRMSPSCAWLFSTTAYVILAKSKDDEGRYLWSPSTLADEPDRLLGNPCYEEASGEAVATGTHPVVYGDFSHYWVRWSGPGMVFDRDASVAFTSFEQTFRYGIWVDGDLGVLDAIHHMIMA
jgi:HK97 family phage major capsid protein